MGEEAPLYYIFGMRGGYGDDKGGDYDDGNSYGCRCFEPPRREDDNKGELEAASSTATSITA